MKTQERSQTEAEKQKALDFFKSKPYKKLTSSMSRDEAITQQMINQVHGKG